MREQRFECENGDYYAIVKEDDNGVITARDYYSELDGIEPEKCESWDSAVELVKSCVKNNEGFFATEIPVTPLMDDGRDACKWGVGDLKEPAQERLKELLTSGKDFDTGFCSSTKELESVRFLARGKEITVSVYAEMDDIPDLFWDALPNSMESKVGENFTDEMIQMYEDDDSVIATETTADEKIPRTASYDEVMEAVMRAKSNAHKVLDKGFEVAKVLVKDYLIDHGLLEEAKGE